jgi:RHS repeat-associated protein
MRVLEDEITYDYDDLYQLTSESGLFAHSYLYDSLYNRLKKDSELYQVNALNQAISHLEYDKNGNPKRQNDKTYTYDALDRLIQITTPAQIQTFQYDSFHRCLSKTITQNNHQEIQYFLYDGQKEIGSFDKDLSLQELRILGHAPHAEIGAAISLELQGKIYAPIHDLQGNIGALLPLDTSEPSYYRYSAFGEELTQGPTLSPWRFSSKRSDASSGLVYYGRRFYIPALGRWLTPDPAGFTDGMNLYAFVHNDPLTHFDQVSETRSFRAGLFTSEFGRGSKPLPKHSPSFRAGFMSTVFWIGASWI